MRIPAMRSAGRPADRRTSRVPEPPEANNASASGTTPTRLLRFPAVRDRTGLSRSTIWRLERRGDFPRHVRISTNAVAWVEQEITNWILAQLSR
jgi:prophage regulatory protein